MFKRSLASVAAVAIASGAVVAPANAVAVRPHNNKTCTFSFTAEEGKLIHLNSGKYPQEKITNLKSTIVGPQLPTLRAQIKEYEEALAKDEFNDDLMRKLEESNKQLTAYEKYPGVTPAPPSNDGAGIGVIFAGAIAAILGILAAALPIIKSILPPQLRALLP
ncbi:hypothetical protein BKD87_11625 [Corynebacterium diphtheriae]|uniref:hypothetical protein n=1 Tax=Corynebacterium diphtheriae TaxID=1717 RepID=UPI0008930439|nr:hypothetical protein [Corynebacterium diphtheriae]OFI60053.1 hypothetical protein BKD87_11625 [Corynebacterium diphtheriae]